MELLAVALALGATMCWGMDQVLGKIALKSMDVLTFNSFRPAVALLFIIPYTLLIGGASYGGLSLIALAASAGLIADFVGVEIYFYLMNRTRANLVIPVGNSDPLWASLFSILFLGEEARVLVFASIAFVVLGGFLLGRESRGSPGKSWMRGVALAAFVALLWGATTPITKYCLQEGMAMSAYQLVRISAAFIGCSALMFAKRPNLKIHVPSRAMRVSALSGFFAFFMGFVLWLLALNMEPASVIAPFLGGKAVFGFLFCALILREKFTRGAVAGMALILLGIVLVSV